MPAPKVVFDYPLLHIPARVFTGITGRLLRVILSFRDCHGALRYFKFLRPYYDRMKRFFLLKTTFLRTWNIRLDFIPFSYIIHLLLNCFWRMICTSLAVFFPNLIPHGMYMSFTLLALLPGLSLSSSPSRGATYLECLRCVWNNKKKVVYSVILY